MNSKSHLIQPDWNPNSSKLRWFGWIALGLLLFIAWRWSSNVYVRNVFLLAGILTAGLASAVPRALKPVYVGLMLITLPIGMIVGEGIMLLVYFGLIFPLSLIFRLVGRDELRLRKEKQAHTFWLDRAAPKTKNYFRQF